MLANPARLAKLSLLFISFLLALTVLYWQNRIPNLSPFFHNPVFHLYLQQLLKAIILLPIFLLWLKFTNHTKFTTLLFRLKDWWLTKQLPVYLSFAFFALCTLIIALFANHGIPRGDAVWPNFQTRIFAAGRLFAPPPIDFRFFATPTIIYNNRWFAYTSPGHSLFLLPFYLLGATYLIGPLFGTLTLILLYHFTARYLDRTTARLTLLLGATSPFMLFLFGSQEFHITSTLFTTLALFSLLPAMPAQKERKKPARTKLWALLSGLSLGLVFLTRPYTAIGVGLPLIILMLIKNRRNLVPFLLGGLVFTLLHLIYNRLLTGNPFTFPYQLMGKYHAIGFGADIGAPTFNLPGHSPLKLLINLLYNLFVLNLHLFGWLFFSIGALIFGIRTRGYSQLLLLWLPALGLFIAYSLYWFHGITPWGPKYYSEALPFFIITSALGIKNLFTSLNTKKSGWLKPDLPIRALAFLIPCSLLIYTPTTFIYLGSNKWGETPELYNNVKKAKIHNALVFIRTDETTGSFDYTSAFIYNDPFLKGDIIFPRDLGNEENCYLLKRFPERQGYIYDFHTRTIEPIKQQNPAP